jgi:putative intracellular protease/amidase
MKRNTSSIQQSFTTFVCVIALLLTTFSSFANNVEKNVLMVVSSNGKADGSAPGYEFDEFAKAYLVFKQHGIKVDVASPNGGAVEADEYNPKKAYNALVLADAEIMAKLNNTLSVQQVNSSQYDGVFVVGGKGAMFDFPNSKALQQVIADVYQQKQAVAAVCHGPAALVNVQLDDGSYLVENKAINGFTNTEEKLFGKKWVKEFDFMLEDKLIERGGKFQSSDMMLNHVAVDSGLITGQNPSSTVAVARELVRTMGIDLQPTPEYRDDKTLALVAKVLDGDEVAAQQLSSHADEFHIELIGMYGFYYLQAATTDEHYQHALLLMQAAQSAINNPQLDMQIAKTQVKLGDSDAAQKTLDHILKTKPDFQPALDMMKTL